MARQPGKGQATPPTTARKPAKDVISQSIEASTAIVADLGDAVQKSAAGMADTGGRTPPPKASAKGRKEPPAGKPVVSTLERPAASTSVPGVVAPRQAEPAVASAQSEASASVSASSAAPAVAENEDVSAAEAVVSPEPVTPEPLLSAQSDEAASVAVHDETPAAAVENEDPPAEPVVPSEPVTPEPVVAAHTPEVSADREPMPAVASYASHSVRQSMEAAVDGLTELNCKALAAFRTNAGMTFDLVRSLIGVKSVAEAILIHTEHARHQFEVMSAQARELRALARKVTTETAAPLSEGIGRTISSA